MNIDKIRALAQGILVELDAPAAPPAWTPFTDRVVRPKPAPLALGPAGFAFVDPAFGAKLWRVTDQGTSSGKSCRVPSNAAISAWSADSTTFYVIDESNAVTFFRVASDGTPVQLPVTIGGYTEPAFSYVNPDLIYRVGGYNSLIIQAWDIATNTHVDVLDLAARYPALPLTETYAVAFVTDHDGLVAFFGGSSQDRHHYVYHSVSDQLLDTLTLPVPFHIHGVVQERSGRYVLLGPTQPDIASGVAMLWIWDTATGAVVPITKLASGHCCAGYGTLINQDCCTGSEAYEGLQWQYRSFASPDVTRDIITDPPSPIEVFIADHTNWRAARPDVVVPFATATFREPNDTTPWRAWDDEVLLIHPTTAQVQRVCHHQSVNSVPANFWDQPMLNVSPDGTKAIFTSNWGQSLNGRQDVFLCCCV